MQDEGERGSGRFMIGWPEQERDLVDRIYERLVAVAEYRPEDLDDLRPSGVKDRDWKLTIHSAEERLLNEGIVFSPLNGIRRKATRASQITGREGRRSRAALRIMERVVKMARAAAPLADDPEEQRRIEQRELKRANAVVSAKSALRGAGMKRPKGI